MRVYLEHIQSQLEVYRQETGHYPDALSDVAGVHPPPFGVDYKRYRHPRVPDTYRIDYYSMEYLSGGDWFDDD